MNWLFWGLISVRVLTNQEQVKYFFSFIKATNFRNVWISSGINKSNNFLIYAYNPFTKLTAYFEHFFWYKKLRGPCSPLGASWYSKYLSISIGKAFFKKRSIYFERSYLWFRARDPWNSGHFISKNVKISGDEEKLISGHIQTLNIKISLKNISWVSDKEETYTRLCLYLCIPLSIGSKATTSKASILMWYYNIRKSVLKNTSISESCFYHDSYHKKT